jgi:hypothetical protein
VSFLRETCHCGHDLTSHYLDRGVFPPVRISCLCVGCNCVRYVNERDPKPPPAPRRKVPPAAEKFDDKEPATDPMWGGWGGFGHYSP